MVEVVLSVVDEECQLVIALVGSPGNQGGGDEPPEMSVAIFLSVSGMSTMTRPPVRGSGDELTAGSIPSISRALGPCLPQQP
jgi:hypothetical protein